jgi:hypothetical protein
MTSFPQNGSVCLKVFGSVAAAAKTQRHDSALRLWHLARMIDDGSGVVLSSDLQAVINRYISGSERHLRRLSAECYQLGWLAPIRRHNGEHVIIIRGLERVAQDLGVSRITQAAYIPATELRRLKAWRVACWDAFMAGRSGRRSRPISRRILERLSGVDPRSQRRYHSASKRITAQRNIAITSMPSMLLDGVIEFDEKPQAFDLGGKVALRLPNSYKVRARLAPRGMIQRINKSLSSVCFPNGGHGQRREQRLFFDQRGAERAMRRDDRPSKCFGWRRQRARSGAVLWDQYTGVNAAI